MDKVKLNPPCHGMAMTRFEKMWYVSSGYGDYLHPDGSIRDCLFRRNPDRYNGYFKTRQAARNAKLAYEMGGEE